LFEETLGCWCSRWWWKDKKKASNVAEAFDVAVPWYFVAQLEWAIQKSLSPQVWEQVVVRWAWICKQLCRNWSCYEMLWILMPQLHSCGIYLSSTTCGYGTMVTMVIYEFDRTCYKFATGYYGHKQVLLMDLLYHFDCKFSNT
jgi:hypothetical protein